MTTTDETTYECERCGHAYTSSYGRLVEVPGGARWLCHDCIDPKPTFTMRVFASVRLDRHDNNVGPRRACEMAARWDPDLDEPVETRAGRDARSVLANLAAGEAVTTDQIEVGLRWVRRARLYYETATPPLEGYREVWLEAARDMVEAARWLSEIARAAAAVPSELTVNEPE